jgi:hypothetical protein
MAVGTYWTVCACTHIAQDHNAAGVCLRCQCNHYTGRRIVGAPTEEEFKAITRAALDCFWEYIATKFPDTETGDLSPEATVGLELAAFNAVKEWWNNNCKDQI